MFAAGAVRISGASIRRTPRARAGTLRSLGPIIRLNIVITLDVLLFASYADSAGASSVRVSVVDDARVSDVVQAVRVAAPTVALPARPLVAVNHRYAAADAAVAAGDEIALIPPVAGG